MVPLPSVDQMVFLIKHILCRLGFPLYDFKLEILLTYGIQAYHLTARSILDLVVFAHLCEAFFSTLTSVRLFMHLCAIRLISLQTGRMCCSSLFSLRPNMENVYILVRVHKQ